MKYLSKLRHNSYYLAWRKLNKFVHIVLFSYDSIVVGILFSCFCSGVKWGLGKFLQSPGGRNNFWKILSKDFSLKLNVKDDTYHHVDQIWEVLGQRIFKTDRWSLPSESELILFLNLEFILISLGPSRVFIQIANICLASLFSFFRSLSCIIFFRSRQKNVAVNIA